MIPISRSKECPQEQDPKNAAISISAHAIQLSSSPNCSPRLSVRYRNGVQLAQLCYFLRNGKPYETGDDERSPPPFVIPQTCSLHQQNRSFLAEKVLLLHWRQYRTYSPTTRRKNAPSWNKAKARAATSTTVGTTFKQEAEDGSWLMVLLFCLNLQRKICKVPASAIAARSSYCTTSTSYCRNLATTS